MTTDRLIPTLIHVGDVRTVTDLLFGVSHSCAVLNGVSIKCWGFNWYGELGDGTNINQRNATSANPHLF